MYCYPVRLAIPSPPLPSVEMHMENNVACVRYKGEMVKVSRNYFSKLVRAAAIPQHWSRSAQQGRCGGMERWRGRHCPKSCCGYAPSPQWGSPAARHTVVGAFLYAGEELGLSRLEQLS